MVPIESLGRVPRSRVGLVLPGGPSYKSRRYRRSGRVEVLWVCGSVIVALAVVGMVWGIRSTSDRPADRPTDAVLAPVRGTPINRAPDPLNPNNALNLNHVLVDTISTVPVTLGRPWLEMDDPEKDGWQTEAFHDRARKQLDRLAELLRDPEKIEPEQLQTLVAAEFACEPLIPGQLQRVFEDARVVVERSGDLSHDDGTSQDGAQGVGFSGSEAAHRGPTGLAQAIRDAAAPWAAAAEVRCEMEVFRVEPSQDRMTTRQYVSLSGHTPEGVVEQHATWVIRWIDDPDAGAPKMEWIGVEDFEQVRTQATPDQTVTQGGTLFADCTESVLDQNLSYQNQLLRGLNHWMERIPLHEAMQNNSMPGVALGDVNGDGLDDLYLCQEAGLPNRLFLQNPNGTLRDVSDTWGVNWLEGSRAALLVDLDNDGDQDLVVATRANLVLAANHGQGRFLIQTVLPTNGSTTSLAAADYDHDGLLDLYVCTYQPHQLQDRSDSGSSASLSQTVYHDANNGGANSLFRNETSDPENWRILDVTQQVGLDTNNRRWSLGASWEDFDNDGDQDLYVANDLGRNNLYRNDIEDGKRTFVDVAGAAEAEDAAFGKSVAWGDYNRDGLVDVYVGNVFSAAGNRITHQSQFQADASNEVRQRFQHTARGNTLLKNQGDGTFADVSSQAAVTVGEWAWNTNFVDVNNDGWEDLFVANGFLTTDDEGDSASFFWRQVVSQSVNSPEEVPTAESTRARFDLSDMVRRGRSYGGHERNTCFLNLGASPEAEGSFANISAVSGLDFADDGRAVAAVDWDQDGDLDLWISNRNAPRLRFLRNESPGKNHFLALQLQGNGSTTNRDAIGTRVEVVLRGQGSLIKTLRAGEGFLSQSSKWLHFGLGASEAVEKIIVRWPDGEGPAGQVEDFTGLEIDGRYRLIQGQGEPVLVAERKGALAIEPSVPKVLPASGVARIPLVTLLPLIGLSLKDPAGNTLMETGSGQPVLINVWASWCRPCLQDLKSFTDRQAEIRAAGIQVIALSVDGMEDERSNPVAAQAIFRQLKFPFVAAPANKQYLVLLQLYHDALMGLDRPLPVPSSFLIDGDGRLAVIYKGPVSIDDLLADSTHSLAERDARWLQSAPLPGRIIEHELLASAADNFQATQHFGHARQAIQQGWLDTAVSDLRQVLRLKPDYALAHRTLGDVFRRQNKFDQAVAFYESSLAINPDDVTALHNLGLVRARQGQWSESAAKYKRLLELNGDDLTAHFRLAQVHAAQENLVEAEEHYRHVIRLKPDYGPALSQLAELLIGQGRVAEGVQQYSRLLDLKPDDVTAHFRLAQVHAGQEKLVEAEEHFRHAIRLKPDYAPAYSQLAELLIGQGRVAEGMQQWSDLLVINPDHALIKNNLAWLLATHPDDAIRNGDLAARLATQLVSASGAENASTFDTLAAAQAEAGRFTEAVATARQAVSVARSANQEELADEIEARLALYQSEQPYRQPTDSGQQ